MIRTSDVVRQTPIVDILYITHSNVSYDSLIALLQVALCLISAYFSYYSTLRSSFAIVVVETCSSLRCWTD